MAHFEVGKKVIAITTSGTWRRGQVFPVGGIKESDCRCKLTLLKLPIVGANTHCVKCDVSHDGEWYRSGNFAPYDDSLSDLTDADILYGEQVEVHEIN